MLPNADRMVDVVQAGRRAGRVQGAGAARVVGGDAIEAVPHRELIGAADLVIDLAEEVRAVHRIGIHTCRHRRTWIADGGQPALMIGGFSGRIVTSPV